VDLPRQVYRRVVPLFGVCALLSYAAAGDPLAESIQLIRQSEWKKAEAALDQIPSTNTAALYWKAYLLFRTARYKECATTATSYLEHKSDSSSGNKVLGLCSYMLGQSEAAERSLKRATEIDPSDSEAFYYLGRLYFTGHNLPEALALFEKLTVIDKSSVRGFNHLGQTLEGLSRFEEAKAAYQRAIQLEQTQSIKSEWPYYNLGVLYLKEGRAQEAVGLLQQALTRNVNWQEGKIQLAVALFSSNHDEDARNILTDVLAADPKNADAHYQMGRLLLKSGKQDEARRHLQQFEALRKPH